MSWVVMTTMSGASAFTSPLAGATSRRGQRVLVRLARQVGAEGAGWGATIPPKRCNKPRRSALDRTCRHASHEVALERDEHGQWQRHLQNCGGGQELPPTTERRGELRDHHRERPELARAKECQRDEQVVPDP